jgi:hypothetical protein
MWGVHLHNLHSKTMIRNMVTSASHYPAVVAFVRRPAQAASLPTLHLLFPSQEAGFMQFLTQVDWLVKQKELMTAYPLPVYVLASWSLSASHPQGSVLPAPPGHVPHAAQGRSQACSGASKQPLTAVSGILGQPAP